MKPEPEFDRLAVYDALAGIVAFVRQVEDRFPEDEIPLLYDRMRIAALEAGAQLAAGFARDGLDGAGMLSGTTQREVAGKLSELRHYILTAASGFILDQQQVATFETLYGQAKDALMAPVDLR